MNWLKAFFKGKAVFNIVVEFIPRACADGKLTIEEITELVTKISNVFDYKIEIQIPNDISNKVINVVDKTK